MLSRDVCIETIAVDFDEVRYTFCTDIDIQSDYNKEIYFLSYIGKDVLIFPKFAETGFYHLLKTNNFNKKSIQLRLN